MINAKTSCSGGNVMANMAMKTPFKDISNNTTLPNVAKKQKWLKDLEKAGISQEQLENPYFIEFLNNYYGVTPKTSTVTKSHRFLPMQDLDDKHSEPSHFSQRNVVSSFSGSAESLTGRDFILQSQGSEQDGAVSPARDDNLEKVLENYSLFGTLNFDIDRRAWKKKLRSIGNKRREKKMMTGPSSFEFREQLDVLIKKKKDLLQTYQKVLPSLSQWAESQHKTSLDSNSENMLMSLQGLLQNDYEYEVNASEKWNGFCEWLLSVRIREVSLFVSRCNVQEQNMKVATSQEERSPDIDFHMSEYEKAKSSLDIDYAAYNRFLTNTGNMMLCNSCVDFENQLLEMLKCDNVVFDQGFSDLKAEYPDLMNKKLQSYTDSNKSILKPVNRVSQKPANVENQSLSKNHVIHHTIQSGNANERLNLLAKAKRQAKFSDESKDANDTYLNAFEKDELIREKEKEIEREELDYMRNIAAKNSTVQTTDFYDFNQENAIYMPKDSPMITDFRKSKVPTPFDGFPVSNNKREEMTLSRIQKERQGHDTFNFGDLNSQILTAPRDISQHGQQNTISAIYKPDLDLKRIAEDNDEEFKVDITFKTIEGFQNKIQVKDFTDDCRIATTDRDAHLQNMFDSGNITAVVSDSQADIYDVEGKGVDTIKSLLPSLNPWSSSNKKFEQKDTRC
ncbi:hypothetical protein ACO0QE_001668 [Hanseniaspora vineae]